jgi:hypothetical protein
MENNTNKKVEEQRILSMDRFEYGKASNRITLNFWTIEELEKKLKGIAKLQQEGLMPLEE